MNAKLERVDTSLGLASLELLSLRASRQNGRGSRLRLSTNTSRTICDLAAPGVQLRQESLQEADLGRGPGTAQSKGRGSSSISFRKGRSGRGVRTSQVGADIKEVCSLPQQTY